MKKIYSSPELIVVKIATVGMLAQSFNKYNDSITASPEESLGRDNDYDWEDE